MRLQTIEQVERRFHSAEAALADMSTRREFAELALDWTRFLNALDDGLSRLISGAQTDAASRRWFAARTKERRVDPLLSYLREARNTPEHGLHPTGKEVDMVLAKLVRIYNARSRIWFIRFAKSPRI